MEKQKVLISGGSGLVGKFLSEYLHNKGFEVSILSRSQRTHKKYNYWKWDLQKNWIDPEAIKVDYIVNLAGAGIVDKRWSKKVKKEIIDSRVLGTRLLIDSIKNSKHTIKGFISASAIGIYGDRDDEELFEDSPNGKKSFMVDCCEQWESEAITAKDHVNTLSILRIGIVLSTKGGALSKFLLPMKLAQANYFGNGSNYYSWIHIQDIAKIIWTCIDQNLEGTYNAVGPDPCTMKNFIKRTSSIIAPYAINYPLPNMLLKIMLGEMAAVITNSNRVIPQGLMDAGFQFDFPGLESAVKDLTDRKI